MSDPSDNLMPPHGGYRDLRGFQVAQLVYDATLVFCERFVDKKSRTYDQMVQAARSGRQNIAEGSLASGTSKKTELKLTNVGRSSLEELLLDYEDFLRQRGLRQWDKDSPEALAVRRLYKSEGSDQSVLSDIKAASPEAAANTMLCLINQASYLLHRQLQRLGKDFLEKGGFTERLYAARTRSRASDAPLCPRCNKPVGRHTARQGPNAGKPFWGCTGYPECRGTRPLSEAQTSQTRRTLSHARRRNQSPH